MSKTLEASVLTIRKVTQIKYTCPSCHWTVVVSAYPYEIDKLNDGTLDVICPNCTENIQLKWAEDARAE